MTPELIDRHHRLALAAGQASACGSKIDYKSGETATKAAAKMTAKRQDGKVLEAYPCPFCDGWHIGRLMIGESKDEKKRESNL